MTFLAYRDRRRVDVRLFGPYFRRISAKGMAPCARASARDRSMISVNFASVARETSPVVSTERLVRLARWPDGDFAAGCCHATSLSVRFRTSRTDAMSRETCLGGANATTS